MPGSTTDLKETAYTLFNAARKQIEGGANLFTKAPKAGPFIKGSFHP